MENLRSIFPTLIYEVDFPNFDSIQNQMFDSIIPYFDNVVGGYDDYYSSGKLKRIIRTNTFELHKDQRLKPIVDFINEHGKKYWEASNLHVPVDPYITHMWAVLSERDGFTAPHTHNPLPVAGAFYVNANEESGDLFLENPLELIIGKQPTKFTGGPTIYTERIAVKPGKLVLFPGWMRHHSTANNTDIKRICIAFNYGANVYYG